MTANAFLDTNVLLYAISQDPVERPKSERANRLLRRTDLGISAQVLGEFYRVSTHPKKSFKLTHQQAFDAIAIWTQMPVTPVEASTVQKALDNVRTYKIQYFDALILAAATEMGCRVVFIEDLNSGQHYGSVLALNPFDPATPLTAGESK